MMDLRERKRELSRSAIADAAQEMLAEQGYAEMSMDAVAARAGISKATLYQYYRSKDELVIAVIERDIEHMAQFSAALDPSTPAIDRLRRVLGEGLRSRTRYSAANLPAMLPTSVWENPRFQAQRERTMSIHGALLKQAIAAGDISSELPMPVIGALIGNLFNIDVHALMKQSHLSLDEACEAVLDGLFFGIAAQANRRGQRTSVKAYRSK